MRQHPTSAFSPMDRPMPARVAALTGRASSVGFAVDLDRVRADAARIVAEPSDESLRRAATPLAEGRLRMLNGTGTVRIGPGYRMAAKTHLIYDAPKVSQIADITPAAVRTARGNTLLEVDPDLSLWAVIADLTGESPRTGDGDVYQFVADLLTDVAGHPADRTEAQRILLRWFFRYDRGENATSTLLRDLFPAAADYSDQAAKYSHDLQEINRIHNDLRLAGILGAWSAASRTFGAEPVLLWKARMILEVPADRAHDVAANIRYEATGRAEGPLGIDVRLRAGATLADLSPLTA